MPALFIVLLKINIALLLFAAAYYLVLRRLTFYTINRAFLVFGILFSSIYPFIDLTDFFYRHANNALTLVPEMNQQMVTLANSNQYWNWIILLFWLGVVVMGFRLLRQFMALYSLHTRSQKTMLGDHPVRIVDEKLSPFSFGKSIYINPALHGEEELNHILTHESVHVKEWHTLDIILAELSVVFYWFNPGVWLMRKAVKENLEFITDEKVLRKGIDRKTYQYSLLDVGSMKQTLPIVSSFNLSDLKKRIRMMNVKRSSRLTLGRYVFILPVLLFISLAFTVTKKESSKEAPATEPVTPAMAVNTPVLTGQPLSSSPTTTGKSAPVTPRRQHIRSAKNISTNQPDESAANRTSSTSSLQTTKVQGVPIPENNNSNPVVQEDDTNVITVVGYRSSPKRYSSIYDAPRSAKDSIASAANTNDGTTPPVRVVTGYKIPRKE